MKIKADATIEDLYRVEGKAEIVGGKIVHLPAVGYMPGFAIGEIYASLRDHVRKTGRGRVVGNNKAFCVDLPDRKSFCPCAAYFVGPSPGMKFFEGAPLFAVEVRSDRDYGPTRERKMAKKRRDYFAAGTQVVWDVDLLSVDVVKVYRATQADDPTIYRRGDNAEAEPAVPGWSMPVDDMFDE